jgi:hypothetical protein
MQELRGNTIDRECGRRDREHELRALGQLCATQMGWLTWLTHADSGPRAAGR